jgi:hypothetical protein
MSSRDQKSDLNTSLYYAISTRREAPTQSHQHHGQNTRSQFVWGFTALVRYL